MKSHIGFFRHFICSPHGWAMECLLWGFWWKLTNGTVLYMDSWNYEQHIPKILCCSCRHIGYLVQRCCSAVSPLLIIGRTVPLLRPPQSPHCYLGVVHHAKIFPLTPGHAASPVLSRLSGHSDPISLKPFDLAQVCNGNKICSKLAWTWKLTLELLFPAHWILNWKLKLEWNF